jgi:hypothetical protein
MVVQVLAELHLDGAATSDDLMVLVGTTDDHDRVVKRAVCFLHKLLASTAKNNRGSLSRRALGEQVVSLSSDLTLLEAAAGAEDGSVEIGAGGLNLGASGLGNTAHIIIGNTTSAEDSTVGEVLRGKVTNSQTRENNLNTENSDNNNNLVRPI